MGSHGYSRVVSRPFRFFGERICRGQCQNKHASLEKFFSPKWGGRERMFLGGAVCLAANDEFEQFAVAMAIARPGSGL